jgi:hypothetical protein
MPGSAPLLADGSVFAEGPEGQVWALDPCTGTVQGQSQVAAPAEMVYQPLKSLAAGDGYLVVPTENGLTAFKGSGTPAAVPDCATGTEQYPAPVSGGGSPTGPSGGSPSGSSGGGGSSGSGTPGSSLPVTPAAPAAPAAASQKSSGGSTYLISTIRAADNRIRSARGYRDLAHLSPSRLAKITKQLPDLRSLAKAVAQAAAAVSRAHAETAAQTNGRREWVRSSHGLETAINQIATALTDYIHGHRIQAAQMFRRGQKSLVAAERVGDHADKILELSTGR